MNDDDYDDYISAHEHLAMLAIEATDRGDAVEVLPVIVDKADNVALLLHCAIVQAEDRALRGEVPGPRADSVRTNAPGFG